MDESLIDRRSRMRILVKVATPIVLLIALAALGYAGGLFRKMPSDSELRRRFFVQESAFAKLADMSNQDTRVTLIRSNFTYLATDASWPREDIGFSQDRWNQYRRLFHELSIDGGVTRRTDYPSSVFIDVYASGGVLGSSAKGYVFSKQPLGPVAQSLDAMPEDLYKKNKGHAIVFESLAPDWYIYREEF